LIWILFKFYTFINIYLLNYKTCWLWSIYTWWLTILHSRVYIDSKHFSQTWTHQQRGIIFVVIVLHMLQIIGMLAKSPMLQRLDGNHL
jgi:hypothetical protein